MSKSNKPICKKAIILKTGILITAFLLSSLGTVSAYGAETWDIEGHWAKNTIQNWLDRGAVKGYEDGTFRPNDDISRAEFMSLVNGIFGYTQTDNRSFVDVKAEAWYATSVGKAVAAGYISGYPQGTMRPNSPITREEVASVLMKINGRNGNPGAAGVFTDSKDATWSKGSIGAVYAADIMAGYPDGSFRGQHNMKRCEALVALDRALLKRDAAAAEEVEKTMNYIALGDSITYGSKAPKGFGYVDLFYNSLKQESVNVEPVLLNLGKPGKNSTELLANLKTDKATIDGLLKADIITISIGGNNLLKPVTTGISKAFKLESNSPTFNRDLGLLLAREENRDKLKSLLTAVGPELDGGVKQFVKDWPEIIKAVRALSPQAEIKIMTIYNPIREGEAYFKTFNKRISSINKIIYAGAGANNENYKVADVYHTFNSYTGTEPLTNFNLLKGRFDVHPTVKGYEEMYSLLESGL